MFPFTNTCTQHELHRDFLRFTPSLPRSQDFGLRVDELDDDRKRLLNCLNLVLLAVPSRNGSRMALEYNVLTTAMRAHCEREEASMKQAGFAGLQEHHAQHVELQRRLSSIHFGLVNSPRYFGATAAFNQLSNWFVPRLMFGDRKFAECVAARGAATPTHA